MTDIAENQSEIKAVKFVLASFARYENETERKFFLRQKFTTTPELMTYFGFSEGELRGTLNTLQEKENLLLTQRQGGIFICKCLNLQ
jgi:acyl-CoA synthetase (AMP-forming)/AMP-acid ligase II